MRADIFQFERVRLIVYLRGGRVLSGVYDRVGADLRLEWAKAQPECLAYEQVPA